MKKHVWVLHENLDGGNMGVYDIWRCSGCGACGGGAEDLGRGRPEPDPFLSGPSIDLSHDCDEAASQILKIKGCKICEGKGWYRIPGEKNGYCYECRKVGRVR